MAKASQVVAWSRTCLPMQETQERWVRSLGWKDPLEKEMATHSSILENSMDRGAWQATVHGVSELDRLSVCTHTHICTHTSRGKRE